MMHPDLSVRIRNGIIVTSMGIFGIICTAFLGIFYAPGVDPMAWNSPEAQRISTGTSLSHGLLSLPSVCYLSGPYLGTGIDLNGVGDGYLLAQT